MISSTMVLVSAVVWIAVIIAVVIFFRGKSVNLYRSRENRMILGLCGGIAEYVNVDPVIIRLLWLAFTLAGGSGILGYIILALVIPERKY